MCDVNRLNTDQKISTNLHGLLLRFNMYRKLIAFTDSLIEMCVSCLSSFDRLFFVRLFMAIVYRLLMRAVFLLIN